MKRVMVDMSATLIHHGHVRLLRKASELGHVVVGLTSDDEVERHKGYTPELSFAERKEVLEELRCVHEVVEVPWLLDQNVLDRHGIDLLVHGDDNVNDIPEDRLAVFPRTEGVSSAALRERCVASLCHQNNARPMFTPGTAIVLPENVLGLRGAFGRGDAEYASVYDRVRSSIRALSGQDEVITMQGSATLALEVAVTGFTRGRVLVVDTGFYSRRLHDIVVRHRQGAADDRDTVDCVPYDSLDQVVGRYDWVAAVYTETSRAFRSDIERLAALTRRVGARLLLDATGSIGLEHGHELADVVAFSSCKGLFGLAGAAFLAHSAEIEMHPSPCLYTSLETHRDHMVTGPYHAIASLAGPLARIDEFRERVKTSKQRFLDRFGRYTVHREENQPLLCTLISRLVTSRHPRAVLYRPRGDISGSVVCHLGDAHERVIERIGAMYRELEITEDPGQ